MTLSARHQRFADAILRGASQTDAAIEAGYSERTARQQGSRLLTNADIGAYLSAQRLKAAEAAQIDAEWVLRELQATYTHARAIDQPAAANGSLTLIGKHLRMFDDAPQVNVGVGVQVVRKTRALDGDRD